MRGMSAFSIQAKPSRCRRCARSARIVVGYESIRRRCIKFGRKFARRLERGHQGFDDTFYIDEAFVKIQGVQYDLWRAVDQYGEIIAAGSAAGVIADSPPTGVRRGRAGF
jgi:putative transposase